MNKTSLIIVFIFVFICFCFQANFSQTTDKILIKPSDAVNKVNVFVGGTINREFYGLPVFVTDDAKLTDTETEVIDGVKITIKSYEYVKERIYDEIQTCDPDEDNLSLAYNEFDYGVGRYVTYSVNGVIFAYYLSFLYFDPDTKEFLGMIENQFYIKNKEDSSFRIDCDNDDIKSIPLWIKEISKK